MDLRGHLISFFACLCARSVRAGNRPYNRGLRLDYTLCSKELVHADEETFPRLLDAFILDQEIGLHGVSDHCPVGVVLGI